MVGVVGARGFDGLTSASWPPAVACILRLSFYMINEGPSLYLPQ